MIRQILFFTLILHSTLGTAQDSLHVIILSDKVGEIIDNEEMRRYRIFPFFQYRDFDTGWLFRSKKGNVILRARMVNGQMKERFVTEKEFAEFKRLLKEPKPYHYYEDVSSYKSKPVESDTIIGVDTIQIIELSYKVGEVIDASEKKKYRLFPYYSASEFHSAQLFRMPDSSIVLKAKMLDGSNEERNITEKELSMFKLLIGGVNRVSVKRTRVGGVSEANDPATEYELERRARQSDSADSMAKSVVGVFVGAAVLVVVVIVAIIFNELSRINI